MTRRILCRALPGLLVLSAVARAEIPPPPFAAEDYLITQLGQGTIGADYAGRMLNPMRTFDRAGDGVDANDIEFAEQSQRAEQRGQAVGQVLGYDLDRDNRVTRAEIAAAQRREGTQRESTAQQLLERFDLDRDDSISLEEALAWPGDHQYDHYTIQLRTLLAMDPNRDGRTTEQELVALASPVFARFDADRDGRISEEEAKALEVHRTAAAERIGRASAEFAAPRCQMPRVPRNARLILVGGNTGESLSSVAVGGQEQATHHIEIAIEPGDTPLYLVLSSYQSTLWQVTGDTRRVVHAVADSYELARGGFAAAGVAGIAAERVTTLRGRCLAFFSNAEGGDVWRNVGAIHRATGRRPDAVFASHYLRAIALPSGDLTYVRPDTYPPNRPVPPGFDPYMWGETLRFWSAGVVEVDVRHAVSAAGVEAYDVMPAQAGLAQLVARGAIERDPVSGVFRIVRPIPRIPSRLGGSHSVEFLLARGVPVPPGDPMHSCLRVEETGELLGLPASCRAATAPARAPETPPAR
ncbi:MAG TPA: hypothetical protein VEX35_02380 [Allosphingosinicella sp.]|nr:hypothetical protein [Allosphingosinicella sp.]